MGVPRLEVQPARLGSARAVLVAAVDRVLEVRAGLRAGAETARTAVGAGPCSASLGGALWVWDRELADVAARLAALGAAAGQAGERYEGVDAAAFAVPGSSDMGRGKSPASVRCGEGTR